MADNGFKLKSFDTIFASTDPNGKQKGEPIYHLHPDKLFPYKNHPFKPYQGQRFDDMLESIRANGVLVPIIARPIDEFTYEILSGHNRVEASKAAGLETIPAIVKEELSDEEALLIVTETNLIQRSFSDLSHSERAVTLSMHYDAIKKQGKRTDMIFEIETMLNASNINEHETCTQIGNKLKSIEKVGNEYGLSKNSIAHCVVCTDNDAAGNSVFSEIYKKLTIKVARSMPVCKDWNETLQKIRNEVKPLEDVRKDILFLEEPFKYPEAFRIKDGDSVKVT